MSGGLQMDAIAKLVLAIFAAAIVYPWVPAVMDQTAFISIADTMTMNASCTKMKCNGDCPASVNRSYAVAHEPFDRS